MTFRMIRALFAAALLAATAASGSPVYIALDAEFGQKSATSPHAIQQGMEIAIEEINAAGGVLGQLGFVGAARAF